MTSNFCKHIISDRRFHQNRVVDEFWCRQNLQRRWGLWGFKSFLSSINHYQLRFSLLCHLKFVFNNSQFKIRNTKIKKSKSKTKHNFQKLLSQVLAQIEGNNPKSEWIMILYFILMVLINLDVMIIFYFQYSRLYMSWPIGSNPPIWQLT